MCVVAAITQEVLIGNDLTPFLFVNIPTGWGRSGGASRPSVADCWASLLVCCH